MPHKIRVALLGIGNASTSFARGLDYYANERKKIGLWHKKISGLQPSDIKIVAAFDIDPHKVDKDLNDIVQRKNESHGGPERERVRISAGLLADNHSGLFNRDKFVISSRTEFRKVLRDTKTNVVVNLISSGLNKTSREYANVCLDSRIAFINATPTRIASDRQFSKKFSAKGVLIVGDDLQSQIGGTSLHKGIIDLLVERGILVRRTYQLDVGGKQNTQMSHDKIELDNKANKKSCLAIEAPYIFESVTGTTEYTDFLGDSRNSYYWISGEGFMGSKLTIDILVKTNDGTNAGNVLMDVVRAVYSHDNRKVKNGRQLICAYGFKVTPVNYRIREVYHEFISAFK
jgi:myo-inositol-1-phosphate synthase